MKFLYWLGCCGAIIIIWIYACFFFLPFFIKGSYMESWKLMTIPNFAFKNNISLFHLFIQIGAILSPIFGSLIYLKNEK
jgi:hypothetical protein